MTDLNKTVKWLIDNAPDTVRSDVRNLVKAISLQTINTINNIDAMENIEKNINFPDKIKTSIDKCKHDYIAFYNKLEKLNIMKMNIDEDIMEMLNSVSSKDDISL